MFEKRDTHHKTVIAVLAIFMVVLTGVNMAFNYFIVAGKIQQNAIEREYHNYGGKEIYDKATMVQQAQLKAQFGQLSMEQIKEALAQQGMDVSAEPNVQENQPVSINDLVINTPIYGKENTPFTILEFSDLECPVCQGFHNSGVLEQFIKDNPDEVNYIYKNFQFHSGAPMKGEAALCVAEAKGGDAFYEYIDRHFKGNINASRDDMIALAGEVGVDEETMKECLSSGKFRNAIAKEFEEAKNVFGVGATPTIIILNNETGKWGKLNNRRLQDFQNLIDSLK